MIRVTHVITGLDVGGAEMALYRLLAAGDPVRVHPDVVSLTDSGLIGQRIAELGIRVRGLRTTKVGAPLAAARLVGWLQRDPPDLVQTWMYHADLLGGLAARAAGVRTVAWGIHQSDLSPTAHKRTTILAARACARLSRRVPATIVCCSEATRRAHTVIGYDASRMMVIPYGFAGKAGIGRSEPSVALRLALGVDGHDVLVGRVGRFHAQKDYATMIKAAAIVRASRPKVHFLLCGDRVTADNGRLAGWLRHAGSPAGIHLLGPREDMATIYGALDLACSSSSFGEGMPNVIGEAMASGVPVVTTDVGDSAAMVGDAGRVVAPGNPHALASAIIELADAGAPHRRQLGDAARRRAEHRYGLDRMADAYQSLYEDLVRTAAPERSTPDRPPGPGLNGRQASQVAPPAEA